MSDTNFEGQHPRKQDGQFRAKPLPQGDREVFNLTKWLRFDESSEKLRVRREWVEYLGQYFTDINGFLVENEVLKELEKNPEAKIYHKDMHASEGGEAIEATYFVDRDVVAVGSNGGPQWVTASDFYGNTPEEILDEVMDAYDKDDGQDDRFA